MPDPIFDNARLAAIYDAFDGERDDLTAYVAIADELDAQLVVDLGCGTGSLAVRLATTGRHVLGVDPAAASLDIAGRKPGAGAVAWVHGDATAIAELQVDLVVMTGNVAQVFLTDDEWIETLESVRSALRPGGHLVFETRRPAARAWEDWATPPGPVFREILGVGTVEEQFELTNVSLPLVSFRRTYRFASDGAVLVSESTLRFRDRVEVENDLLSHGFSVTDVRDAPDRPRLEDVFVARRE